ncbi:MAG: hypothetical protein K2X55_21420 [Burkholderiaceae bacterium]|nr:hypothetical protein [Burkholderiaceae bacterium]
MAGGRVGRASMGTPAWVAGFLMMSAALCLPAPGAMAEPHGHTFPLTKPATGRTLVLSGSADSWNTFGLWLTLIYTEAFGRLGYGVEYRPYPAKRASLLADQGEVDGEIHRAGTYGSLHPELVQVATSHFSVTFCAYGIEPLALGEGWNGLKDTPLRVEYRSGVSRPATVLATLVPADRLSAANNVLVGLRKLARGRTDVFVDIDTVVEATLVQPEFQGTSIRKLAQLETVPTYAFLHRRHSALAGQLGPVLADMKREGLIEKFRLQAIAQLRP